MADTDDIPRGPLQGLQDLAKSMGGDPSQPQMATFMRGLMVGAFVGAAVAGSTIWRRRRDQAAKLRALTASQAAAAIPAQPGPDVSDQNLDRSTSSTTTASPPSSGPETSGGGTGAPEASPDQT